MHSASSKFASAGLIFLMSLAGEPALLLAQQTTAPPQQTTPSQSPQQPAVERQQQEDKASQELIHGKPETGVQLPPSPDATQGANQQALTVPANPAEQPTGTAAAQEGRLSGSIASRPAGVAVAPAKQRQVRSLLIKTGVVAAAGVAIGTVYGLSRASGSTPPGAK